MQMALDGKMVANVPKFGDVTKLALDLATYLYFSIVLLHYLTKASVKNSKKI